MVIGVLWVVVTHPLEGPVIFEISEYHGIHRYDFLAIVPPLAALCGGCRPTRSSNGCQSGW